MQRIKKVGRNTNSNEETVSTAKKKQETVIKKEKTMSYTHSEFAEDLRAEGQLYERLLNISRQLSKSARKQFLETLVQYDTLNSEIRTKLISKWTE